MSQLVACHWPGGVALAADRRVETKAGGQRKTHTLKKLFPLGTQAAVATSGAAVGIWVSRVLARLLRRRGALALPDLENYALSVFQKEYDGFVAQGAQWFAAHPNAYRRSYVLVGGKQPDGGFDFRFHASEEHGEPYHPLRTHSVLTAPRRLGLESRLHRLATVPEPDEERIVETIVAGMRQAAAHDEAVAAPFDTVLLSRQGVRWQTFDDPPPTPRLHLTDAIATWAPASGA